MNVKVRCTSKIRYWFAQAKHIKWTINITKYRNNLDIKTRWEYVCSLHLQLPCLLQELFQALQCCLFTHLRCQSWLENPLQMEDFSGKNASINDGFPIVQCVYRRVRDVFVSKMNHDSYLYFWYWDADCYIVLYCIVCYFTIYVFCCMHACMHACICIMYDLVYVYVYVCMFICLRIYIYIPAYMCMYMYTYVYVYIYICKCVCMNSIVKLQI